MFRTSSVIPIIFLISQCVDLAGISTARADFEGELVLEPVGCEETGQCKLGSDFGFVDDAGIGWQAAKGLLTDGASIPPWARPFVGQPFEEAFIKAAVIHDHYCDRRVRPWRQTHKVFREALLKSAVEPVKAGIMYFAVLIGGPKWVRLIPGKPCPVGTGCINNVNISTSLPGNNIAVGADGDFYLVRQNRYASASFSDAMNRYTPEIEDLGDSITEEQIENIANEAMADDFYYRNEDEIGTGSPFNINNNMK